MLGTLQIAHPGLPCDLAVATSQDPVEPDTRSLPRLIQYPQGALYFEEAMMPTNPATLTLKDVGTHLIVGEHVAAASSKPGARPDIFLLVLMIDGVEKEYIYHNKADCDDDNAAVDAMITPGP